MKNRLGYRGAGCSASCLGKCRSSSAWTLLVGVDAARPPLVGVGVLPLLPASLAHVPRVGASMLPPVPAALALVPPSLPGVRDRAGALRPSAAFLSPLRQVAPLRSLLVVPLPRAG